MFESSIIVSIKENPQTKPKYPQILIILNDKLILLEYQGCCYNPNSMSSRYDLFK